MNNNESLYEKLKALRVQNNCLVDELAKYMNTETEFIDELEAGKRPITIHAIKLYCSYFNIDQNQIIDQLSSI